MGAYNLSSTHNALSVVKRRGDPRHNTDTHLIPIALSAATASRALRSSSPRSSNGKTASTQPMRRN
eukprot:scaffold166772_cov29-Tisochrysis_lutea.AAC.4